ncbi:MAG: 50S ribosomal protein L5 [Deltaproteobacteria bacterium]|nr:MAG: 50S ribosomal protein L5 [Deltaproteobacteria bacterium]
MSILKDKYMNEVVPALTKQFNYSNRMQVPRLEKVVVNMGLGDAVQNIKILDSAVEELTAITGQKVVVTKARKSIASFKLREGMPIGCMVTLRQERMYEFLERLISVVLPRIRDFKGISGKAFDGRGNYTLGLRDQMIFPEIDLEKVDVSKGMNVVVVNTAKTDEEGKALLSLLGFPFRK